MTRDVIVWLRVGAGLVLALVAAAGAVLSFASLEHAARPIFGGLAPLVPVTVDLLILGASLAFAAGAKVGRPMTGWRVTAHAAATGTVLLNAAASQHASEIPWHVAAPIVWSVIVELVGRELLGEWRAKHAPPRDRIPGRLWLIAPRESLRTWLWMARTGAGSHDAARLDVGLAAAVDEALRLTLGGRGPQVRRARRIIGRQLAAGSIEPVAVLDALGWSTGGDLPTGADPHLVLRAALAGAIDRGRPTPRGRSRRVAVVAPATDVAAVEQAAPPAASPVAALPVPERAPQRSEEELVAQLRAAIEAQELEPRPTVERARAWLGVRKETASRVRARVLEEPAGAG